jgi:spore germination protein GerM
LGTAIPQGISIQNVDIMDGVVILDLDDNVRLTSGSSSEEMLFAQQLAHTALLDSSLNELRVLINGEAISELWGHIDWSMPITADPSLVVSG